MNWLGIWGDSYVDLISTWKPGRHFAQTSREFREVVHSNLLSIHNTKCFLQGRKLEDQSFKSWEEIVFAKEPSFLQQNLKG